MKLVCKIILSSLILLIATSLGAGAASGAQETVGETNLDAADERVSRGAGEWDKETLRLFGSLPIQEGGRVKPLSTLAGFKLLKFNGKRKLETPSEQRLTPTALLMDCLFFPEVAETYKFFRVQNDEVLVAIGLHLDGKRKRDYYSFAELRPNFDQLMAKAREWTGIEAQEQKPVQRQLLGLARNVREFLDLAHEFDFSSQTYQAGDGLKLKAILGGPSVQLSTVLVKFAEIRDLSMELGRAGDEADPDYQAVRSLLRQLESAVGGARLAFLAPVVSVDEELEWRTATDLVREVFEKEDVPTESARLVGLMEDLVNQRKDAAAFSSTLAKLHAGLASLADVRGEYWKIPVEQKFYKMDFFYRSLVLFLFGFLFAAIGWLKPWAIWLQRAVWGCVLGGTVLATVGITMRCIIRSRPPVSTLYETILFTGVVCVIVALVIEYINRQRIALALAAIFGSLGMWVSMKYELKEAVSSGDTMPSLQAVLDTNFWLSTHVTTVTMGYSAGLLAALFAHVWVLGKAFGLRKGDTAFYKSITRMVYGVLCFGLLFSVVGTILGGIWANYSWGRFWGWDPKENGALLICLFELLILHLRMGGFIRDRGLCNLAILGGCVVSFSWWGVNLLSIGLHTYGFTSGIALALYSFMAVEVLILLGTWLVSIGQGRGVETAGGDLSAGGSAE